MKAYPSVSRTRNALQLSIADYIPLECQLMCCMSKSIAGRLSGRNLSLCRRLLADLVTEKSGPRYEKRFNYVLFKRGIIQRICFCYKPLYTMNKSRKVILHSREASCYRAVFAHTVVYEIRTTTFLPTDNLNDVLSVV